MIRLSRIGLGTALAVVLAGARTAPAAEPDKLIPADADTVLSVNIRQVLESDIIKKYALQQMKQALQGNDAQKILTQLGLDPLKDIERIVIGGSTTAIDPPDAKYLAIVHGKFDPAKIYQAAEAQAKTDADHFSLIKDGNDKMFKFQPESGNPLYGTVVDATTIVVGSDKKSISTALAAAGTGGQPGKISKELSALVAKMDDTTSIWVASVVKGKLDKLKLPGGGNPNIQGQLGKKMDTMTISVRVTTDVNLEMSMGMADADAAAEMGKTVEDGLTQLRGLLPFLTAQSPQLKPLTEVGKTLKSAVKEKSIVISAKLTGSAIGQMLNPNGD